MNLAMTSLSDAWSTPNRPSLLKTEPIQKETNGVSAYNSNTSYDEYLINVDSFKPFRIDVCIKNPVLIGYLKTMSTREQTDLVTKVLLEHFEKNPATRPTTSTNEDPSVQSVVEPPIKMEMILPNSTPNSTAFLTQDTDAVNHMMLPDSSPVESRDIEYMKAFTPNGKDCNDTVLLIILILATWMLIDRIMHIM